MPLRGLASRLAALSDAREIAPVPAGAAATEERRTRKRAAVGAVVVALAGVAVAYSVWHAAGAPGGEALSSWLR
jgi:hypothetical protein